MSTNNFQPLLRLIMVRHGQTDGNSNKRFVGHQDIPLNETGLQQVHSVARRLMTERPAAIFSSDLQRAYTTAHTIQLAIQESIKPDPAPELITDRRLREIHFGAWEGLTYSEIEAVYPEVLGRWEADIYHTAAPGGESLEQLADRVLEFLEYLQQAYAGKTVIVAGHGGTFEAMAIKIFGLEGRRSWQFQLNNTGVCEFRFYPEGPVLYRWNDTSHLEDGNHIQ